MQVCFISEWGSRKDVHVRTNPVTFMNSVQKGILPLVLCSVTFVSGT